MKLGYKCTSCNHVNKISALLVADRMELARKKGAEFELRCGGCGVNNKVHVDDVYAESDLTVLFAGIGAVIIAGILTVWWWKEGFIATASMIIPVVLIAGVSNYERNKIKLFNFGLYDSQRSKR